MFSVLIVHFQDFRDNLVHLTAGSLRYVALAVWERWSPEHLSPRGLPSPAQPRPDTPEFKRVSQRLRQSLGREIQGDPAHDPLWVLNKFRVWRPYAQRPRRAFLQVGKEPPEPPGTQQPEKIAGVLGPSWPGCRVPLLPGLLQPRCRALGLANEPSFLPIEVL